MIIGILGDSHGDLRRLEGCLDLMPNVEILLHTGDFFEDAQKVNLVTGLKTIAVTGNCDYMVRGPSEEMIVVGDSKVYLTHGHLYRVKRDYTLLSQRAAALGVDVVVFGHTHRPTVFRREGRLFVNPGSLYNPRGGDVTCALLEVTRAGAKAKILTVPALS